MILQLNPPIPLDTEKGQGLAHLVIDYGPEHSLIWVTALDDSGQIWCIPNEKVRFRKNWTFNRTSELINGKAKQT